MLLRALKILQLDVVDAALRPLVAVEQAAEHRIAVEAGHATPHDTRLGIDERSETAVADDGKVERGQCGSSPGASSLHRRSRERTAASSAGRWRAAPSERKSVGEGKSGSES